MSRFDDVDGAREYAGFRNEMMASTLQVREGSPDEASRKLPSEYELQSRWFAGEFGNTFQTTCGKELKIRQFGHWNHSGGPDFSDAAIEVDGEVLAGGIELDPDVRDWEAHGHGANPAFDKVVLHVFFRTAQERGCYFTRTSQHQEVAQLHLSEELLAEVNPPRFSTADAHPGRCATPLAGMAAERVNTLLAAAAQMRIQQKARRLRQVGMFHGKEQAFFFGLAEALGYRYNQLPMRILAQRLPIAELLELSALEAEARLFGHAGFLRAAGFDRYSPPTRGYLRKLWDEWWKERDDDEGALHLPNWRIAGARPGNHPERRLGALSAIVRRWDQLRVAFNESPVAIAGLLAELEHPFWSTRYTLQSRPAPRPISLVGKSRVTEILANVLYPIALDDSVNHWDAFLKLPAQQDNEKLRRAAIRLFGERKDRGSLQKYVYQQQGLLQIYQDFCLEDDSGCSGCPFPEQLMDWKG